jgi:nucleoid-associated protein YgaU
VVIIEEPLEEPVKKKLPFWKKKLPATHTVKKGECLWYIAGYPEIYGNPLEWPKIYKANRDIIRNPDLIYSGQVLRIPREGERLAAPKPAKKKWIK